MSEYSVDEVRAMARGVLHASVIDKEVSAMLNAYADLREQIERAREGVSSIVNEWRVLARVNGSEFSRDAYTYCADMLESFQSIAHLLPSVRGVAEVRCEVCDGTGEVVASDGEWRGECRACKYRSKPSPPAQAAQVDLARPWPKFVQDECLEVLRNMDTELSATGRVSNRIQQLINTIAGMPTAEPVAQGEAVDSGLNIDGTPRYERIAAPPSNSPTTCAIGENGK
jgi:hypothetical protein